ncbi:MAG: NAD-dependent epimerase/dehydratase family protein [Myxococcales bacterium]|nr:NAD-dependent epimerase/dehydratase family protein [Myxococcales bacterium]
MSEHGNGGRRSNGNGKRSTPPSARPVEQEPRKYWVGGATGFLGAHLVRLLVARGHQVVAVSRGGGDVDGLPVLALDVSDADAVAESARGADGAFVATGKVSRDPADAEAMHLANVVATRQVLAGLERAGVRRVVYASTSGTIAVSEDAEEIADEEASAPMELIATWPYYRSKSYAEKAALEANHPPTFDVVVVNPSLLLGPGDLRESSTGDVRRFLERAVPAVPAGGLAFVDARDAALGMLLAFEHGRAGERYLLNAQNLTLAAFFQRLSRLTGVPAPRLKLPASRPLALGMSRLFSRAVRAIGGEPPVDDVSVEMAQYFWYCSSEKAERELGWVARDPGETLRDTVEDLVARGVASPRGAWASHSH